MTQFVVALVTVLGSIGSIARPSAVQPVEFWPGKEPSADRLDTVTGLRVDAQGIRFVWRSPEAGSSASGEPGTLAFGGLRVLLSAYLPEDRGVLQRRILLARLDDWRKRSRLTSEADDLFWRPQLPRTTLGGGRERSR